MVAVGISALAVIVAALSVVLIARAGATAAAIAAVVIVIVMAAEYELASAGVLREWQRIPPPFMIAVAVPILLSLVTALSPVGRRIAASTSFAAIVGIQAFRLPLELVMHEAARTGLMPVQMSYTGWNFDIVSGTLAIAVAWIAWRSPQHRGLVFAWNLIGTVLLIVIVAIAVASTPLFAAFGPDHLNTWVADPPYVFLPTVLVPAAVFGHTLTWRKLAMERGGGVTLNARARSSGG